MKTKQLKKWTLLGMAAGLMACAQEPAKPSTQPQANSPQAAARANNARAQAQPPAKLGENVEVPSTTQIETTQTQRRVERHTIPTIEERTVKADINRMSVDDFVALGLDTASAENIVQYRRKLGPFSSVQQLDNVPNVDRNWIASASDRLAAG